MCASGVASILLGWGTRRLGDRIAEYYSLLCFAGAGMCLLASANGFVSLFVALELFSIALYVLCALDVHDAASLESGLKYLVTGSVGSAALLFGSGLVYIATGSLRFDQIGKALDAGSLAHRASCCSASRSSSRGSPSRPRRRRSTCGRPTSTRARRPP